MLKPDLTLEGLLETRLPRLDPVSLPLRQIRGAPAAASLAWVAEAEALLPPVAEAAGPMAPAALEQLQLGPFSIDYGPDSLVLRENGVERWRIETGHFGGQPTLEVERGVDEAEIKLSDAFYPGTLIPASLRARVYLDGNDWTLRLRLKYGGFDATLKLSDWLAGMAVSPVHLDSTLCPLGPASELAASGPGLAAFRPNWLLGSIGFDLLRLPGFETGVTADAMLVALFGTYGPAFFLPASFRRSGIWLVSFEEFPLQPEFSQSHPRIHMAPFRFDSLAIEAGLAANGNAARALYAQAADDPTLAGLEPGGDLLGSDGQPFRSPLRDPRYLQLFDHDRDRIAAGFVAEVADERVWMHSPGQSLQLGRAPRHPAVAILDLPDKPLAVLCRLGLRKTAPRVETMIVRPQRVPLRTEMVFTWGPLQEPLTAQTGHVEIDLNAGFATLLLPPDTSLAVVRRDDFLALGYEWTNRRFWSRGKARSLVEEGSAGSHLAVVFPPQSIGEEVYFEASEEYEIQESDMPEEEKNKVVTEVDPKPPPIPALLAKPSRLVFGLDEEFEVTATSLLDWDDLKPSLAPTALPGSVVLLVGKKEQLVLPGPDPELLRRVAELRRAARSGRRRFSFKKVPLGNLVAADSIIGKIDILPTLILRPSEPLPTMTQIEIPFRLILSPNRYGVWLHTADAVTHGDRTELWHTRLAVRYRGQPTEEPHVYRTVRAIWSRDFEHQVNDDEPFLMPLNWDDRKQLVELTSDFTLGIDGTPRPVTLGRLMLSALGGWLDSNYQFALPDTATKHSIEQWRHRATLGRDHYVRVVYKGFLFPWGHQASLVKISERKIEPTPEHDPAGYIRQRMYLIVRQPERTYTGSGYAHGGREMPFKRVRITTVATPNLDPPGDSPLAPGGSGLPLGGGTGTPTILAFWPRVGNRDFHFHLKAWDWEGHEIDFLLPLAFVRQDWSDPDFAYKTDPITAYNTEPQTERRQAQLGGQQVAYAEAESYEGKTTFDTASMRFKTFEPAILTEDPEAAPLPPYLPELESADVAIAALRQMTGSEEPATIELDEHYLEHVFDSSQNKAGLFAKVPAAAPALDYKQGQSADRSGGVATPNLSIEGLSRELGTVGDTSPTFASGTFTPQSFFPAEAQLLGGITLSDILEVIPSGDFLAQTPKLVTTQTASEICTALTWTTTMLKAPDSGRFKKKQGGSWSLRLDSTLKTDKEGGGQTFHLEGELIDFTINLADVIEVDFPAFRFSSTGGKKPDVHVEVTDVRFVGDLEFLNKLDKILNPGSFADPPYIDVTPQGITAGYDLTIPTVAMGVFALSNLALGAQMTLPFTGEPMRLRFNLSERHDPFIVSVAPFGGGGFFAISVGGDGVELLEASIEFGGNISVDLGVASGGVSLMAGVYLELRLSGPDESSSLTGYVRANGELEVLGIISISMEFYLGLTYKPPKAWGEVRVTVTIEVLVFSGSVTVTMRKEFAGSSHILPFGVLMPQPRWAAYAGAFA